MKHRLIAPVLLLASLVGSGCVSGTLGTVDTQPQAAAAKSNPRVDPQMRAKAVAEMRLKAEQTNSGVLTNAFADPDGPNETMTPQDQDQRIEELSQNAAYNSSSVPDSELDEKQRSIQEMQNQARTHYNSAVQTIQN